MSRRYTFVGYNGHLSDAKILDISVPQGGCLAPLLFILYMNDIKNLPLIGKIYLFADDISLVIKAKSYPQLQQNIDHDLNLLNKWLIQKQIGIELQ